MACYPNLIGEMAKREITKKSVAKQLGISERALHNKLSGTVSFASEGTLTRLTSAMPRLAGCMLREEVRQMMADE